jgi:uncharacterized protein YjbJ (UPF0337 family)
VHIKSSCTTSSKAKHPLKPTTTITTTTTATMSTNKDQTSTLQSYVDSATGAAQSVLGSLTGSTADKVCYDAPPRRRIDIEHALTLFQAQGENRKTAAEVEKEASHTAAKAGPFTVSASGGVAQDDPNRTQGSWNQNMGAAKEAIGGFVGAEGLKQEGIQQNREGKGQEAQGQMSDLGKGVHDRVGGTVGGAVAGLTGNAAQKAEAQKQHDEGKARQRGVEADLQKEADA